MLKPIIRDTWMELTGTSTLKLLNSGFRLRKRSLEGCYLMRRSKISSTLNFRDQQLFSRLRADQVWEEKLSLPT